jgi:hypothetical protein
VKPTFVKTFLIWSVFLNWPPILVWIPPVRGLCFLPFLFWINIPALWLGLARLFGHPHYDIQEFGALPQTVFAWMLIVIFWLLVAVAGAMATTIIRQLFTKKRTR